jgi:hypothetical protein
LEDKGNTKGGGSGIVDVGDHCWEPEDGLIMVLDMIEGVLKKGPGGCMA